MKVCVIQPQYCTDHSRTEEFLKWELEALDQCDESMDIIAMPESSDTPCLAHSGEERLRSHAMCNKVILDKAAATAKRCKAIVFINARSTQENGMLRNTTFVYDREGNLAGQYHKQHLTPGECTYPELEHDYTYEHEEPTIIEVEGIKFAFLVCYDAYFYEAFANIARYDPDVVVACSHQRSDTHEALRTMHKFCAYNTNAWVIRASVRMGVDAGVGGTSMVIAPDGTLVKGFNGEVGSFCCDIEPKQHYLKPAGFGGKLDCHHRYVDVGRRPWKYRIGGAAIVPYEEWMEYPRVCAHRGFNTVAPENTLPAYGAAIAMGAEEIEFDLWLSKDGVVVSMHDKDLDRVSTGTGFVWEHTFEELLQYDFGVKKNEKFAGMRICTFEDILKRFAGQCIMNIHVKNAKAFEVTEAEIAEIARLIKKYDCERHCYFMSGAEYVLDIMQRIAPQIPRCAGAGSVKPYDLVAKALKYDCKKIQIFTPDVDKYYGAAYVGETCRRAHEAGLHVNICQADTEEKALEYLEAGCDTILTNDFNLINNVVKAWKNKQ
jgi:glycerophosphoryl diester phosphodiesterase/predicted amidohydrolase